MGFLISMALNAQTSTYQSLSGDYRFETNISYKIDSLQLGSKKEVLKTQSIPKTKRGDATAIKIEYFIKSRRLFLNEAFYYFYLKWIWAYPLVKGLK